VSALFRTYREYSRIVETVTLTEEGTYVKDRTPDEYGGSMMNVEIVHRVTMMDATGYIEELQFENPVPKSKDGKTASGEIKLDGTKIKDAVDGGADPREWTTRKNDLLTDAQKALGDRQVAMMKADKEAAGGKTL
jgi:hypothetical protein